MPLITVTVNPERSQITKLFLKLLGRELQQYTAEALTCTDPGGQLKAEEVEVKFEYYDVNRNLGGEAYDVAITVMANDYPSRKTNLDDRCLQLKESVQKALPPGWKGFVWILLAPGAFQEF